MFENISLEKEDLLTICLGLSFWRSNGENIDDKAFTGRTPGDRFLHFCMDFVLFQNLAVCNIFKLAPNIGYHINYMP